MSETADTHKTDYSAAAKPDEKKAEIAKTDSSQKPESFKGTIHKKSTLERVKEEFFGDRPDSVKNYIIYEVVIPSVKSLISTAVTSSVDALLYGSGNRSRPSNGQYRYSSSPKGNSAPWEPVATPRRVDYAYASRNAYRSAVAQRQVDVEDITFESRDAAQYALDRMQEYVDAYGSVSVLRYYDICGVSANFAQDNYGWTSTRDMTIGSYFDHESGREMYQIIMPPAVALS